MRKKLIIRILTIICCAALVLPMAMLLTACNGGNTTDETTPAAEKTTPAVNDETTVGDTEETTVAETEEETTEEETMDLTGLFEITPDYVIVIDKQMPSWVSECAEKLQSELVAMSGVKLEIIDDDQAESDHEIVLGQTSRAINSKVDYVNIEEGYEIKTNNGKVILGAAYEYGLKLAVKDILGKMTGFKGKLYMQENPESQLVSKLGIYDIADKTDLVSICYSTWFDYVKTSGGASKVVQDCLDGKVEFDPYPYFHYWGEPEVGFYNSSDEDVVRTHMRQLEAAGIDFIILDLTNGECGEYDKMIKKPMDAIIKVIHELQAEGYHTPRVAPWTGWSWNSRKGLAEKVLNYYTEENSDVFVYWDEKPFFIDYTSDDAEPYSNSKVFVKSMVGLRSSKDGKWSFLNYPNEVAYGKDGKAEQVAVCCAVQREYMSSGTAVSRRGGLTFWDQWQLAFEARPKIVTVTWWNEWTAQRLDASAGGHGNFTDAYNEPYSRDIEPMKGGHGSQYYDMLCGYVEAYKNHESCPVLLQGGLEKGQVKWDFTGEDGLLHMMRYQEANTIRTVAADYSSVLFRGYDSNRLRDPYFMLNVYDSEVDASEYKYLAITYMIPEGASNRMMNTAGNYRVGCGDVFDLDEQKTLASMPKLIADGKYHTAYLDLTALSNYQGRVNTIRVDFAQNWTANDSFYITSAELTNSAE